MRSFRIALLWLMAWVLPLQAVAVSTKLMCAPAWAQDASADLHAGHRGKLFGAHGASQPAADPAVDSTVHGTPHDAAHEHTHDTVHDASQRAFAMHDADADHPCSACDACHVGAVLPGGALHVAADDPEPASFAALPWHAPSVVLAGLERPPRSPRG